MNEQAMRDLRLAVLLGREEQIRDQGKLLAVELHHGPLESGLVGLHVLHKVAHKAVGVNRH